MMSDALLPTCIFTLRFSPTILHKNMSAASSSAAPAEGQQALPPLSVHPSAPIDPNAGIKLKLVALEGQEYDVSFDVAAGAHPESGIIYGHSSQFIRDMIGVAYLSSSFPPP